ncbi:MAG: hypothetical protein IH867_10975 [Chloroflexi bacterium]|nr:hypothetical protein [Chloroflexota bacterium]
MIPPGEDQGHDGRFVMAESRTRSAADADCHARPEFACPEPVERVERVEWVVGLLATTISSARLATATARDITAALCGQYALPF